MSDLKELERLARAAGFILPTYLTTFQSGNGPDVRTFAMLSHDDPDDEVLTGIIDENELSQELSPMLVYISALLNAAPALLKEHKALKARVEELEGLKDAYTGAMEDKRMWKNRFHHLLAQNRILQADMESIANNTCCDECQEAKLVAQSSLLRARQAQGDSHE